MHFPTGASNRWGRGEQSRGTATVASCHSGLGRSFSTQLLMPRCPPAIYHSSLIDMHCPQIPPPCFAPSIPHFPLWISAAGSCQDCTDVHKHLPTMYVHVFTKLLSVSTCRSSCLSVRSHPFKKSLHSVLAGCSFADFDHL